MTCRHAFHKDCVDKWLQTGKNNCPACRSTVSVFVMRCFALHVIDPSCRALPPPRNAYTYTYDTVASSAITAYYPLISHTNRLISLLHHLHSRFLVHIDIPCIHISHASACPITIILSFHLRSGLRFLLFIDILLTPRSRLSLLRLTCYYSPSCPSSTIRHWFPLIHAHSSFHLISSHPMLSPS